MKTFRLKTRGVRWLGAAVLLLAGMGTAWALDMNAIILKEPVIDAGDPTDSADAEPLPNGALINMGGYGGTEQASQSL